MIIIDEIKTIQGIITSLKILLLLLVVFVCEELYSQTNIQAMRFHYKDGTTFDIPIASIDSITFKEVIEPPAITHYIESNEVLNRAYQMASMEWTPLRPIPKRGGGYYPPDTTVVGSPYSSVKEINTYLFLDVSYHTFMTAVHNPMSVLYTENISRAPYHGSNCATYYGTVCSSSVMWALGIDIPYYASQIINLPDMVQLEHQVIDSLKICDVMWKQGHVQMIYDLEYNSDTLFKISTFETSGNSSHIKTYTKKQFRSLWNNGGYVGYRYEKLIYSTTPRAIYELDPVVYNDALCPSKGDRAVYRTSDTVTINVFDTNYSMIVLSQGSTAVASDYFTGDKKQYFNLEPGVYSVFLQNEDNITSRVSFEVIETNVGYTWNENNGGLLVHFQSSATPVYAALCDIRGNSRNYVISDQDRQRGYFCIPQNNMPNLAEYYCKVVFNGEYGRIINEPILVE